MKYKNRLLKLQGRIKNWESLKGGEAPYSGHKRTRPGSQKK